MYVLTLCHLFTLYKFFISNARLKLEKNQAKAKQQPETELLLIENYSLSSSMLSSKNNGCSKKCTKSKYVCLNEVMITDNENETEDEKQITELRYK